MRQFKDTDGRQWAIAINVETLKRVRDLTEINLLEALEGKLFIELAADPIKLCDVIYAICQPQADLQMVSDLEFGRAMAGDAIEEATTALLEDLVDFFPQGRRQLLRKGLAKAKSLEAEVIKTSELALEDPRLTAKIKQQVQDGLESALNSVGS